MLVVYDIAALPAFASTFFSSNSTRPVSEAPPFKSDGQRLELFEQGTMLRRLAECFELLLPVR
jgi:hypothetical protein